jgi:hypothetical protein
MNVLEPEIFVFLFSREETSKGGPMSKVALESRAGKQSFPLAQMRDFVEHSSTKAFQTLKRFAFGAQWHLGLRRKLEFIMLLRCKFNIITPLRFCQLSIKLLTLIIYIISF